MGWEYPPYYGKDNFYEKKLQQINKKIEKLLAEKEVCEKEIAKKNENK